LRRRRTRPSPSRWCSFAARLSQTHPCNYAYHLFHAWQPFQGVGRGARPAAARVSEEERTAKPHCGRCMSAAVGHITHKAVNEGATYRICMDCYYERRGSGEQDSKEVWECPSAAQGKSDCLCSCAPKQAAVGRKQRKSSFSSRKKQKHGLARARSQVRIWLFGFASDCAWQVAPFHSPFGVC
jgi:hypothetical protein